MSSNVMPHNTKSHKPIVAPEPPPVPSSKLVASIKRDLVQKAIGKVTRALYDSGADDHTNDPFIIFKLRLLPKDQWTTLYVTRKRPHVT